MSTDLSDLQEDVNKAADVLDELEPSWPSILVDKYRHDLADMKVNEPNACVTFAVFGSYGVGENVIFDYTSEHGIEFDYDPFACLLSENYLWREAWRRAVVRRLGN